MGKELKSADYAVLSRIAQELKKSPTVERTRSMKAIRAIEAWCEAHDVELGDYRWGNMLRFDRRLLATIDATLESLDQPRLGQSLSGLSTREQAKFGSKEDKYVREPPRRYRVLVSVPATPRVGFPLCVREALDVDGRKLELAAFDALVQVENLDSHYDLNVMQEELGGFANPLVVYRGDSAYRQGFDQLAAAWAQGFDEPRPHLYLGDFDAAGVREALSSGASHLLLPPLDWLAQRATPDHQLAEQLPRHEGLIHHLESLPAGHPLRDYLALILDEQRGLLQQWFEGPLKAVALR
ncbi:hypothetical protein KUV41_18665 [Halomonas sp. DP8Y7-1]|uniref:DUF7281 domain-containing protein n=1 Tax=Halomonas sp. DP8Y7-1 TaxID=2859078 RepID=UPI001C976909|nr:hypothetical protein [Halomonas sp. DP8Y7-1]MBY6031388.1 hypothetical protein [Halomonas sp. DP8Y7-1]